MGSQSHRTRLVVLAAVGAVYAVLATRYYVDYFDLRVLAAVKLMVHTPPLDLIWLANTWMALALLPITIVLALFGASLRTTLAALVGYLVVILLAWYYFTATGMVEGPAAQGHTGPLLIPEIAHAIVALAIQTLVWGLLRLARRPSLPRLA